MGDHFRPHRIARRLHEVDARELLDRGIRAVIIDLDNTLTPWRSLDIPPEHEVWIRGLGQLGITACIVSNAATARRVRPVANRLGIQWITRAMKPFPAAMRRAMRLMNATPDTTAIIGDQLFTDIYGGNCLGLFTILVDPITEHEAFTTRLLQRPLERLIGRTAREAVTVAQREHE